ncbi:helix-turn-helix domain-containing protein [Rhodobacteraceae bacterium 2CG4]|uniref:Helix-turn-helix domain-containing protein n=1 Tax=Halovulum marinum TaxID=2662447 RepID=A0A6L5Z3Y4_9RHOB|nr:helix-turn-helix domain-containing protein [Halovulum marinum]MSU90795.1 helix-turn-helix domain-containing protein [Halovulum marinum]
MTKNFLLIDPETDFAVLKSAASEVRVKILKLLHSAGGLNVNDIARRLSLPQSSVSSNVQILEQSGLIRTESHKARKGSQKLCYATYDELIVTFAKTEERVARNVIEVAMPLGLFTNSSVAAPCGICSPEGIIGLLDVPETFMDPERMKAALLWFTSGFVEYQFPNNAKLKGIEIEKIEFSMEVSSEVPGTHSDWPSDITISINGTPLGNWTSPGDFGDKRGVYTPDWWKLSGSQYGMLKTWQVSDGGSFVDGRRISDVTLDRLDLDAHRSIRLRIEVDRGARHPGGINVFGRGFGNYDQDIVLRLHAKS